MLDRLLAMQKRGSGLGGVSDVGCAGVTTKPTEAFKEEVVVREQAGLKKLAARPTVWGPGAWGGLQVTVTLYRPEPAGMEAAG